MPQRDTSVPEDHAGGASCGGFSNQQCITTTAVQAQTLTGRPASPMHFNPKSSLQVSTEAEAFVSYLRGGWPPPAKNREARKIAIMRGCVSAEQAFQAILCSVHIEQFNAA